MNEEEVATALNTVNECLRVIGCLLYTSDAADDP